MKIRDVTLGEKYTTIRVSGKTGERAIPLIKSVPYLRQWIQVHPDRNPDSLLFATVVKGQVVEASGGARARHEVPKHVYSGGDFIPPHILCPELGSCDL